MGKSSKLIPFPLFGVAIPTLVAYFLFWYSSTTVVPIKNERTQEGNVRVVRMESPSQLNRLLAVARAALQVPFDLSNYNICLRNQTKLAGAGGETFLDVQALIMDESGKTILGPIFLSKQGRACGEVSISPFVLGIGDVEPIIINAEYLPARLKGNFDIAADEDRGAWPTRSSQIVSTFIFLIAYGAVLKLLNEYINWLRKFVSAISHKGKTPTETPR